MIGFSFGTVDTGRAWFRVLYDGDKLPGWTAPEVNAVTFVIPGSTPPRSETQVVSIGPSTVRWRVAFDSMEDYWTLLAKLATVDVLTAPANVQTHRGNYRETPHGLSIDLPGTILLGLDADTPAPDGYIEAVATFQRHIDPVTGLLVAS